MAIRTPQTGVAAALKWPALDSEQGVDRITVKDASAIDSPYLRLAGEPPPAVRDPRDEDGVWVGLRVDNRNVTNEVVGIMVENFRLAALPKHPDWADVLVNADQTRQRATRELVAAVANMPAGDGLDQG